MGFGSYGILFFPSELKYGNFGKNLMMPIYGFDAVHTRRFRREAGQREQLLNLDKQYYLFVLTKSTMQ
jgi:hypothetical protein